MANPLRMKRRVTGAAGAPASLLTGEPAWNMVDNVVYGGFGDDGAGNATSVVPIGGAGAFVALSGNQTIDGVKTFSSSPLVPTPDGADDSTKAANTAWVKALGYLLQNQVVTLSGDIAGSGRTAITATLPNIVTAGTKPKITYNAKGQVTAGADLTAGDIPSLTAAKISDFDTQVRTSRLDQMAAPTAALSVNGQRLTSVADPVSNTDAVTKRYADALKANQDWKDSVRAAATSDIALSGLTAVGGITPVAGDRVAALGQSVASENGIYVAAAGAWSRATDMDEDVEVSAGLCFFVEEGDNQGKQYILTTTGDIVVGTTDLSFTTLGAGQTYSAGDGIDLAGTVFSVGAGAGLTQEATGLKIDTTWTGTMSITGVGTLTAGVWQATVIALGYGGTGADLSGASDGAIFKKSGTALVEATPGTDYLNDSSTIDGGTF